jgi:putative membrane protein
MRHFLLRWLINAAGLYAASQLVPGIYFEGDWRVLLAVAFVFGLVNALLRPLLALLTCPLIILTLGLFTLVLNAVLLLIASALAQALGLPYGVDGFGPAFWGALVISLVSLAASLLIGGERDKDEERQRR